ncbi:LapA family protein [Bartonella ancashensis]|uniref:Permeases of the major facilitator superfamily n=1 Tax=Bartonella ancashensis TaxID=1318743 RepID=A0A0M3T2T1_9HYPH|nr:LapA family protein [Bartonella ancashensis]ALE03275.1 Permeases of the major facilitator superfamily [Bartonella ancashensis]
MTSKRILLTIILAPFTAFVIAFAVDNRQMVTLTFNPFKINLEDSIYQAPLFVWLFIFFGLGLLIGSSICWFTQHRYRKALKKSKNELEKLKAMTTK